MPTPQEASKPNSAAPPISIPAPLRAVFHALVKTIVPGAQNLSRPDWVGLDQVVDGTLSARTQIERRQLRLLLRLIQWLPVLRYGRSFTSLSPEERAAFLSYLEDHHVQLIRCGFFAVRTLALLGYYGRPEAGPEIGYTPHARGWEAPG
jgi:hypothetical protein